MTEFELAANAEGKESVEVANEVVDWLREAEGDEKAVGTDWIEELGRVVGGSCHCNFSCFFI